MGLGVAPRRAKSPVKHPRGLLMPSGPDGTSYDRINSPTQGDHVWERTHGLSNNSGPLPATTLAHSQVHGAAHFLEGLVPLPWAFPTGPSIHRQETKDDWKVTTGRPLPGSGPQTCFVLTVLLKAGISSFS